MSPSVALAQVFVDELFRCGVTEAVVSPGSWSTPLTLALYNHDGIRLHVRIDERSAAFLALGLAKASRRPVVVVCTSGTAAANLHPAVLEAHHSAVPLVVLTADRAPELRQTGFNQATDQIKLFGDAVCFFAEVGVPEARRGMVSYWRSLIGRAVGHAIDICNGGPVHLNVALRKPFISNEAFEWPDSLDGRSDGSPWVSVTPSTPTPVEVTASTRGVLILGDGAYDPDTALMFAERAGWPVIAEPSSQARRGKNALSSAAYLLQVPSFVQRHQPELVVTVGKVSLSQGELGLGVLALIKSAQKHVVVDPTQRWPDPGRDADVVIPALGAPRNVAPSIEWLDAWRKADRLACEAIDGVLENISFPTEPHIARDLIAALPSGALLIAGPSMPIRDLDATMRPREGVKILTNRGLSGIDGVVSTAVGAALAHQHAGGGPAYALLGDLTLLHDHNGLIFGTEEPVPDLTIVVINNNGGALFSILPQQSVGLAFERLFGTPHGVNFSQLAAATGMSYCRLEHLAELEGLLTTEYGGGIRLIETQTDRVANAEVHHQLLRAVTEVFH